MREYQQLDPEDQSDTSVKTAESPFFFHDDQIEDGGEIFIIRDEFDRQQILRPRRKFSW